VSSYACEPTRFSNPRITKVNLQCCKVIVSRNVRSFDNGRYLAEERSAFSSLCISIKAFLTASTEIQREEFFVSAIMGGTQHGKKNGPFDRPCR